MIECYRYSLFSRDRARLNSQSSRQEFNGALIRVDGVGVGCIHPWPELGDASLDDELAALVTSQSLPLGQVAMECAAVDGRARERGESLFRLAASGQMPASHWSAGPNDDPGSVAADGFEVAKIKLGADLEAAIARTERWAAAEGIERLRLDFNAALSGENFVSFWSSLSAEVKAKIEFIEDPTPFDIELWRTLEQETGAELAIDVRPGQEIDRWQGWIIVKPAVLPLARQEEMVQGHDSRRIVFTSYMEHAIGQMWAAYRALCCAGHIASEAGILSHERFAAGDPFFDRIRREGSRLVPLDGTGLGFDDLLEDLPWQKLT